MSHHLSADRERLLEQAKAAVVNEAKAGGRLVPGSQPLVQDGHYRVVRNGRTRDVEDLELAIGLHWLAAGRAGWRFRRAVLEPDLWDRMDAERTKWREQGVPSEEADRMATGFQEAW